jgi:hypothetical protein
MVRFFFILVLLTLVPTAVVAQERAEKFEYQVTWANSDVATLKMQRGCKRNGYVPASLTASALGVAEQIHSFQIRLDSFSNGSGYPLEGRTHVVEEGIERRFKTRFREDGLAKVTKKFRKKESVLKVRFRRPTHDLLSWAFALREEKLERGESFTYHVWDGWKLVRLQASVKKRERVWTPDGTHAALRIELTRTRLHHRGKKAYREKEEPEKIGTIWITPDASRVPVAMDFDAPVGVAKIRLTRTKKARCSLD